MAILPPPAGVVVMAGAQQLRDCVLTICSALQPLPSCRRVRTLNAPLRAPCQATQTFPAESVAATGQKSVSFELEIWTAWPSLPPASGRAQMSKLATWLFGKGA